MQNSNDKIVEKSQEAISNEELERVNRRLDVSKGFFAWVLAGYFLSTLMTVGSNGGMVFPLLSKGLLVVLVLGCGGLFYSSYAYWAILRGGIMYSMRFVVMLLLAGICIGALLRNFGIF